jgi:hypothetical protein
MRFDEVLAKAVNEEISGEEALFLLRESKTIERYLELFRVASYVRKSEVSTSLSSTTSSDSSCPCTTSPPY